MRPEAEQPTSIGIIINTSTQISKISKENPTEVNNYPPPVQSPWPTMTEIASPTPYPPLPPLENYPVLGPFKDMLILYARFDQPGYYSSQINGDDETVIEPFLSQKIPGGWPGGDMKVAPDGSKILYSSWNNMDLKNPYANSIWVSDVDGTDPLLLVAASENAIPEEPVWSPDAQKVAYRIVRVKSDFSIEQVEVWTMNADGSEQKFIWSSSPSLWKLSGGKSEYFKWQNNGYLYIATRERNLLAINPDSGQTYPLLDEIDSSTTSKWLSPDGYHIASSSDVLEESTRHSKALSLISIQDVESWNLQGDLLVTKVSGASEKASGVWFVNLATGEETFVTDKIDAVHIDISPDGTYVAYQTEEGIYIFDLKKKTSFLAVQNEDPLNKTWPIFFKGWIPVK